MAYVFESTGSAKISAVEIIGEKMSDRITIPGVTSGTTTPANARNQINKLLAVVKRSIAIAGMKRTLTEEAVNE